MNLRQYLETAARLPDGQRMVYFIAERGSANQFYLLCAARKIHVFNAAEPFAESFLERYATAFPARIHLSRLDVAGSDTIFEPVPEGPERDRFQALQSAYFHIFPDLRCIAKVSRFAPREIPALLTGSRDTKTRQEMEAVVQNVALPPFIREMVHGFLGERRDPLTLHLNADNPIVQRLASWPSLKDEHAVTALVSLYNNAVMLLARAIPPEDVRKMFEQSNNVIELMLSGAEEREKLAAERMAVITHLNELKAVQGANQLLSYVTCFVAMPFRPDTDAVYAAIEKVLEDFPFLWSVVRADERTKEAGVWENVKRQMLTAHCFIADVSEANPNVMIEIGRMEAIGRPLVLIRRKGSPELPVDLRGRVCFE
jgi:hypothetical protein